jgi:hypothetical protein
MTPEEKAIQLVDKFYSKYNNVRKDKTYSQEQKRMALICVNELIKETSFEVPDVRKKYWEEVKKEIDKLIKI